MKTPHPPQGTRFTIGCELGLTRSPCLIIGLGVHGVGSGVKASAFLRGSLAGLGPRKLNGMDR